MLISKYKKYDNLISTLNNYMPRGIKKIRRDILYSQTNINKRDLRIFEEKYEEIVKRRIYV